MGLFGVERMLVSLLAPVGSRRELSRRLPTACNLAQFVGAGCLRSWIWGGTWGQVAYAPRFGWPHLPPPPSSPLQAPYKPLTCPLQAPYMPLTSPLHAPYMPLTSPLYMPLTSPLHAPYMPLTSPLEASYKPFEALQTALRTM